MRIPSVLIHHLAPDNFLNKAETNKQTARSEGTKLVSFVIPDTRSKTSVIRMFCHPIVHEGEDEHTGERNRENEERKR